MPGAGKFDRRIQVQTATFTNDAAGDPIPTWADAFKRWAIKRERGMVQGQGATGVLRETAIQWTLRDDTESRAIAPETHRIVYEGRVHIINGISEGEEGRHKVRIVMTTTRPDQRGTVGEGNG